MVGSPIFRFDRIGAIERTGDEARLAQGSSEERAERQAAHEDETGKLRRQAIFASALTLPIVVLGMGSHLREERWK
jgi:hypothetical protein